MLDDIRTRVEWMKRQASGRDSRMELIQQVRAGDIEMVDPAAFSDVFPKPVVANFIQNAAEDFANAVGGALPALNCTAGAMRTDADKRRGAKKNKIGNSYWEGSRLPTRMFQAADHYDSFGFAVFYIEPDFDAKAPHIYVESSVGSYYLKDRRGRVTQYARCWQEKRGSLMASFPEAASQLMPRYGHVGAEDEPLEVVRYCDDHTITLYTVNADHPVVLADYANRAGKCPVAVAERPALDKEQRGRYDDAVWPQLARNRMRMYLMEATEKSVHAPTWVGFDVTELSVGPDAIIQSDQEPKRVHLDVPQAAFAVEQSMQDETRVATKHPSARDGMTNASVVTGRGVEALMGQFDGQIKAAQVMIGAALSEATGLGFRIDEAYFPNDTKDIEGLLSGESYSDKYTPAKDIAGNYSCAVDYGFAAGLGAGQALVFMLQAQGAGLISKQLVQRNLPLAVDVDMEQRHIEAEKIDEALLGGIQGLAAALPQMATQGMDVTLLIKQIADVKRLRTKGQSLESAVSEAMAPPEPSPAEAAAAPPGPEAGAPGIGQPPAAGPPDLMNLIAGLRNGQTVTGANIQRQTPV